MKTKFISCFIIFLGVSKSIFSQTVDQDLPSDYGTFAIPLWSKVVLELKSIDSIKFEYRILSLDPFEEFYSFDSPPDLFSKKPGKNTVEIYFVGAYFNEGKEDSDYKTTLVLRNNLQVPINYSADIKYYHKNDFENTSIVGAFPNAKTVEMWHQKIEVIALYDFEILKSP